MIPTIANDAVRFPGDLVQRLVRFRDRLKADGRLRDVARIDVAIKQARAESPGLQGDASLIQVNTAPRELPQVRLGRRAMLRESDLHFHLRRAREELDLAGRSECRAAMESHLRLSALHIERLKGPDGRIRWPRDPFA